MSKFADILIILLIILLYAVTFGKRSNYVTYAPIKGIQAANGVVVSTSVIADYVSKDEVVGREEHAQPQLSEFKIYSEYPLPERFIANTVDVSSLADYILLTEQGLQEKLLSANIPKNTTQAVKTEPAKDALDIFSSSSTDSKPVPRTSKRQKAVKSQTRPITSKAFPINTVKVDATPDVLTYPSIEKYVLGSNKSFIYPSLTDGKDVVLTLISVTPYNDKIVVRYSIDNQSKSYFFIESTLLTDKLVNTVLAQKFGEDFVSPGKMETVYLLAKTESKQLHLKLTSSGGTVKCLEIDFTRP